MQLVRFLRACAIIIAPVVVPALVSAHPGHDHSDIPSVIRHPFVSAEHVVVTLVVAATLAIAAFALGHRLRKQMQKRHR